MGGKVVTEFGKRLAVVGTLDNKFLKQ